MPLDSIQLLSRFAVYACWFAFSAIFLLRRKPPKSAAEKRALASWWGIGMQTVAFFSVFNFRRELSPQVFPLPQGLQDSLSLAGVPLAVVSAWLAASAVRTLGKQWSVGARLTQGHQLIVAGAYSHMRHPIYTAMLGMLISTGLVITFWPLLIAAVVLFSVGTAIRVHAEEKLLREAFGEDFDAYTRYVPAILPRFHISGAPPKA